MPNRQLIAHAWLAAASLAIACASTAAYAQQSASMPGMNMPSPDPANAASTQAFQHANDTMMKGMSAPPYTGNVDKDFVTHMIPHHQGAVDMAEIELKYGKDPAMKALAKRIVSDQRKEIALMQTWNAQHGGK